MPGVDCSIGPLVRLDVERPFFLRQDAFTRFTSTDTASSYNHQEQYGWDTKEQITILVKSKPGPRVASRVDSAENMERTIASSSSADTAAQAVADTEGCPLECPFDPNENFDDAIALRVPAFEGTFEGLKIPLDIYDPVNIFEGRRLLKGMLYNEEEMMSGFGLDRPHPKSTAEHPTLIACDAKDIVLVGFDKNKYLEVRMLGPYQADSRNLDLKLFLSFHQELPNAIPTPISQRVHAIYEKIHGDYRAEGKSYIEVVWSDPKVVFEQPPPTRSKIKVAIRPKPGDANPYLKKYYDEIRSIDSLLNLKEMFAREANKSILNLNRSSCGETTVLDEIKRFLKLPSIPAFGRGRNLSRSIMTLLSRVSNGDRTDSDFTDAVWPILRKITTVHEAYESLMSIFVCVENKMARPYLYPSNPTIFGEWIKGMLSGGIKNFRIKFSPMVALEMILDIGLTKVYRDFSFIMKTAIDIQPDLLEPFNPNPTFMIESIDNLKKLECVMEVLSLLHERFSFTGADLEDHANTMLKYFQKKPLDWEHTFHFDVNFGLVSATLVALTPIYWNLRQDSSNPIKTVRTNVVLCRDSFIPYGSHNKLATNPDATMPRGFYIYVYRTTEEEDKVRAVRRQADANRKE